MSLTAVLPFNHTKVSDNQVVPYIKSKGSIAVGQSSVKTSDYKTIQNSENKKHRILDQ